jgi:hypothetical protein
MKVRGRVVCPTKSGRVRLWATICVQRVSTFRSVSASQRAAGDVRAGVVGIVKTTQVMARTWRRRVNQVISEKGAWPVAAANYLFRT